MENKFCSNCGNPLAEGTAFCPKCGQKVNGVAQTPPANVSSGHQSVIIQQAPEKSSNGLGTAGFILALLALLLYWIPVLDFTLWILGLIFSFIGIFKRPRGLAIAGLVISLMGIIIIIALMGTVVGIAASI